jgi:hypothetical protein
MGGRVESGFEFGITCPDIMRNYRFSKKLKLLGNSEFNHLINILTHETLLLYLLGLTHLWNLYIV